MHPAAGDRRDVHHRALRRRKLVDQAARQRDRREEIHVEHLPPEIEGRVDRAEARAVLALGGNRSVVDESVEPAADALADLLDAAPELQGSGEIELDMILAA